MKTETITNDTFWFDIFSERHPDEVKEIMDSKEYKRWIQNSK